MLLRGFMRIKTKQIKLGVRLLNVTELITSIRK